VKGSIFTWIAGAIGIAVLVAVVVAMVRLWNALGPSEISPTGWVALALGIVVTLALGVGLVAAMLISHHRGYDDNPRYDC